MKLDGSSSSYFGIRAPTLYYQNTEEYQCKAGIAKGFTLKTSVSAGLGFVGASASASTFYDGTNLGLQGAAGFYGRADPVGGAWGVNYPSPGVGWTW